MTLCLNASYPSISSVDIWRNNSKRRSTLVFLPVHSLCLIPASNNCLRTSFLTELNTPDRSLKILTNGFFGLRIVFASNVTSRASSIPLETSVSNVEAKDCGESSTLALAAATCCSIVFPSPGYI